MLVWGPKTQKEVRIERLAPNLPLPIQENSGSRHPHIFQNKGFSRCNLVVYWKHKYRGKQEPEPRYSSNNLPDVSTAVNIYRQLFGIEAMFKDCKPGGSYNLESSQASPDRLVRLILFIALAMTPAWLQGQETQFTRKQCYVCRPCENQRTRRRHSGFWIGLYGYT
jgi:hypothetical protein